MLGQLLLQLLYLLPLLDFVLDVQLKLPESGRVHRKSDDQCCEGRRGRAEVVAGAAGRAAGSVTSNSKKTRHGASDNL